MTTSDKIIAACGLLGFASTLLAVFLNHLLIERSLRNKQRHTSGQIEEVKVLVNGNLEKALFEVKRQKAEIIQLRREREAATEAVSTELHLELDALRRELQRQHDASIPHDDWLG